MDTKRDRRTVARLAAALGLGGTATPASARAAVAAVRDADGEPVPPSIAALPDHDPREYDPVAFAHLVSGRYLGQLDDLQDHEDAEANVAYVQARSAFLTAHPEVSTDYGSPFTALDEAADALKTSGYFTGLEVGASVEYLRGTMRRPTRTCPTCHGRGDAGSRYAARVANPGSCASCGGTGVVRMEG